MSISHDIVMKALKKSFVLWSLSPGKFRPPSGSRARPAVAP
jgi:hypothetical protein